MERTKTLTMRTVAQQITITGQYIRERKDGRKFFDIRKAAADLAKELIACGALIQTGGWSPDADEYRFKVFVYAAHKAPGLEGTE